MLAKSTYFRSFAPRSILLSIMTANRLPRHPRRSAISYIWVLNFGVSRITNFVDYNSSWSNEPAVHAVISGEINVIRVLLADDQILFREGLHSLLVAQSDIEIVGEAGDGEHALRLVDELRPDLVLMDVRMPILDGVAATRLIHANYPDCRVLLLTTFDDDEYVFEGLRAGASGYLLKDVPVQRLLEAIHSAARGETFLQPSIAAKVVAELNRQSTPSLTTPTALTEPLSAREIGILRLIARGYSNREIAGELVITEGTVKNHVTSILGKLGVRDRTQAVIKAQDLRLV